MVERFDLERFEWNAPDRLALSGRFHGLQEPRSEPVLVVNGDGDPHRLHAAQDSVPEDGEQWRAEFVWDGVPVGVDSAVLELGPDIAIELPPPGAGPEQSLDVRHESVALQAQALEAEQHTAELRAALERAEADLARARSDVESERSGRAADAQRFRDGLARVQASADEALTAERAKSEREIEALRERIGGLEHAGAEAGELRADAERLVQRLTGLVDALDAGK